MKDDFMCSWYWIARINLRCPNLVGFIDLMKAQGYSPRWLKKEVLAPIDLSLSQMADEVGNDAGALLERTLCWCALGSQVRQVLFLLISATIVYCAILVTSGWNTTTTFTSFAGQFGTRPRTGSWSVPSTLNCVSLVAISDLKFEIYLKPRNALFSKFINI